MCLSAQRHESNSFAENWERGLKCLYEEKEDVEREGRARAHADRRRALEILSRRGTRADDSGVWIEGCRTQKEERQIFKSSRNFSGSSTSFSSRIASTNSRSVLNVRASRIFFKRYSRRRK